MNYCQKEKYNHNELIISGFHNNESLKKHGLIFSCFLLNYSDVDMETKLMFRCVSLVKFTVKMSCVWKILEIGSFTLIDFYIVHLNKYSTT